MTEKDVGYTYTRQARRMIEAMPEDDVPTVVAGDFNASKSAQHLGNVERLRERGLVSAYHRTYGGRARRCRGASDVVLPVAARAAVPHGLRVPAAGVVRRCRRGGHLR
jgi:hypothetical protein